MQKLPWLMTDDPFPPPDQAFSEPDGLLAAGADLSPARLISAYQQGIFPWYNEGQPVLWWSPDPRCVLYPTQFRCSRSLKKSIRRDAFHVTANGAFADVINACATTARNGRTETWITNAMHDAYCHLHESGWAHSVEVWQKNTLVGGVYGLAIGRVFFGESMFSRTANASKTALLFLSRALTALDFVLLDCQVESPHLLSLGAISIPRTAFQAVLTSSVQPLPLHKDIFANTVATCI